MFVLATMDTPDEVAVLDTLRVGADVLQGCFFVAGLKTREPAIVHRLNIMSSNPYYAKEKCQDDQWGFNFQAREGELARELQKMKLQNEKKQREIDSMLASDKEIQEVRRKIEASYLSKQRAKQLAETQYRKLNDLTRQAQIQASMLKQKQRLDELQKTKQLQRQQKAQQAQQKLVMQMQERKLKQQQAFENYTKEKEQVDREMRKLIEQQRRLAVEEEEKKKKMYEIMVESYKQREIQRKMQEERDKAELEKIAEFQKKMDVRSLVQKEEMKRKEQEREKIFIRLKAQEEARRKEQQQLEQLRFDYYQLQAEESAKQKDAKEAKKREEFKKILVEAQKESKLAKEKQKQQQTYLEQEFRRRLLQKFAQEDRLEQLALNKRRIKQQEHKRQVERLWEEKLEKYREAREQERRQMELRRIEELKRIDLVKAEKERLIREHAENLEGFLHPDLVEDAKRLTKYDGKPFPTNYSAGFKM